MPTPRHCRHCFGDCGGVCLLPGTDGLCIHHPVRRLSWGEWVRALRTRALWRRVFWGVR
jgi:hypothetical protein